MLESIIQVYTVFLYQPIYNLVILLYNFSPGPNLGWSMVMLALIVRLAMLPLTLRGYHTDHLLEESAADLRAIENDSSIDSRQRRDKITEYLRIKGINPTSEIISVIAQILFLAILYQVVQNGITPEGYDQLYSFVKHPQGDVNTIFSLGVDVSHPSFLYSAIAAGLLFIEQIWEYETKKNIPQATFSERWYPLLLPTFTFILLVILPATKAVFLATSIVFSLGIRLMFTLGRASKGTE